jgi:type VI secretion system secreted protein VgrG
MTYTQANRRIAISTPLGDDVLLLRGFTGSEAISQLFHFDLDLLSENDSITFQDVVGKNVSLRIFDAAGSERYWNGFVSRFSQESQERRFTSYRAQMVPWLWFLTRTADCRIFQNKKVPDIIQRIFSDLSFHDFELRLYGDFTPREYCVQYRETDFNFVSRLMEEEGIYYFFQHQKDKHVLVLANDPAAHEPCPNQKTARYDFRGASVSYEDVVTEWRYEEEFRPGAWAHTDYNFETPSTSLAVTVNGKNPYEIYDFPGEHAARSEGDKLARIRLQEQTAACAITQGSSGCRYFNTGYKFTLKDHYRTDLNQMYLLTKVRHISTQASGYEAGGSGEEELTYRNTFECIPFATPFRPARITPQPFVQGCQTAVVVGPAGEEIYTDKYGRVKVQFHWDREGKRDADSSCWVRVSHPWAGKGWGAVSIPRIGQEVIVDFLEGDPDRPIIVGRVYNAEQTVPFGMPGGAVVSGIKSNSTKGGGGFNEISLNDTKGNELIQIHGQYDMDSKIEHDERLHVVNNRTKNVDVDEKTTIGNNRTEHVGANETISVDGSRSETVHGNETIHVALLRTRNVGINEMVNVGGAQEVTVGGLQAVSVAGARMVSVGAMQKLTVKGKLSERVGASRTEIVAANQNVKIGSKLTEDIGSDQNTKVGGNRAENIGSDDTLEVGSNRNVKVGSNDTLDVGSNLVLKAGDQITLQTGSSKIVLKSSGDIEITGTNISVQATAALKEQGATIDSEASGIQTVKGSMVKINC